jgi:hypothetical protein
MSCFDERNGLGTFGAVLGKNLNFEKSIISPWNPGLSPDIRLISLINTIMFCQFHRNCRKK